MRFTTISCVCLACAVTGVSGQSLISTNRALKPLTEDECIRLALEHNLRIQIRRLDPNIERYRLAASYGVYDPVFTAAYLKDSASSEGRFNPTTGVTSSGSTSDGDTVRAGLSGYLPSGLTYDVTGNLTHSRGDQGGGGSFDDYISGVGIDLSQPLLKNFWIDANRLAIQINKKTLQISQYNFEFEIRTVVRDVQVAYFEVARAREEVKVQEKALELAQALVAQNKEKVRVGTLAPLDEKQAESQAATTLADLLQAQRQLLLFENVLKGLITDKYEEWLNVAVDPTDKLVAVPEKLSLVQSMTDAIGKRPDYLAAKVATEAQGLTVKYRYNQLFPLLNVTGGYGYNGLDNTIPGYDATASGALRDIADQNNPGWNFGALLQVPLARKSDRNLYKSSKENLKQVELQMKQVHQTIIQEVDNSITQVLANYERVGATRQARLYAEDALDAEQKKLDNGKSTSFQVLEIQRDLTTARSDEFRALADYNESLAQLYYRDGTSLDRKQISVQFK